MKCLLAFYCTLPVWSRASFGTQLGNHPPGMIGPRLLGVDKSVSSIRVTVIKCFRGCTRLLAAVATTKIYVASVETMPREPMIREKGIVPVPHAVTLRGVSLKLKLIARTIACINYRDIYRNVDLPCKRQVEKKKKSKIKLPGVQSKVERIGSNERNVPERILGASLRQQLKMVA